MEMGRFYTMDKITLRYYILEHDRIRRAGLNSQGKRKFAGLAGKSAILVEVIVKASNPPVITRICTMVVDFDEEGKWDLNPMEMRKVAYKSAFLFEDKTNAPSNVVHFFPQPKLSSQQLELLKAQVIKEFGIATWNIAVQMKLVYTGAVR